MTRNDLANMVQSVFKKAEEEGFPQYSVPFVEWMEVFYYFVTYTRFASSLVNVLEVFSAKDRYDHVNKPLDASIIDEISFKICDQNCDPINFMDDQSLTCIMHICNKN